MWLKKRIQCASLDNKGYSGAILMDLFKAFDTLNHDLLIANLHAYGFSKKALFLIKSYLSNRWQRTKINNSYSFWTESLLPKGSILGPLLFNINLNDLFFLALDIDICNIADDNTLSDVISKLEFSANLVIDWFWYIYMKLLGICRNLFYLFEECSVICFILIARHNP